MTPAAGQPVRRRAADMPEITGLRFLPDRAPASLVNMSSTGLLAESTARFRVGSDVTVQFEGGFEPEIVTGRVARCEVATMGPDGVLRYYTGIEFDEPVGVNGEAVEKKKPPKKTPPAAVRADVRNRW